MQIHAATMGIIAAAKCKVATTKLFGARREFCVTAPIIIVATAIPFSAATTPFTAMEEIKGAAEMPGVATEMSMAVGTMG